MVGDSEAPDDRRQSAFEIFLRTGRRVEDVLEIKFNPWHDPQSGRFTFAGSGKFAPGGGSMGGGGATGRWESRKPSQPAKKQRPKPAPAQALPSGKVSVDKRLSAPKSLPPKEQEWAHERRDGYDFSVEQGQKRTRRVTGFLHKDWRSKRSKRTQAEAGKPDRLPTDDGGHYIGVRFGGPREWFNHFAQDAKFNRQRYKAVENSWSKALDEKHRVFVDIVPHYEGRSRRPYSLSVTWYVDTKRFQQEFPNGRQGQ